MKNNNIQDTDSKNSTDAKNKSDAEDVLQDAFIKVFNKLSEFKNRGAEVIAVSIDSAFTHIAYKNTAINDGGIGHVKFPMVSDITKEISRDYDVLHENSISYRGTFLIDKNGIVRHQVVNDLPLGRNVDEAIRMVDALLYHEKHGEVCPANWKPGKEAITPNKEGIASYLKKNSDTL